MNIVFTRFFFVVIIFLILFVNTLLLFLLSLDVAKTVQTERKEKLFSFAEVQPVFAFSNAKVGPISAVSMKYHVFQSEYMRQPPQTCAI